MCRYFIVKTKCLLTFHPLDKKNYKWLEKSLHFFHIKKKKLIGLFFEGIKKSLKQVE